MMNEKNNELEIMEINEAMLQSKIYLVRGQKVMLDFELAEIYGYTTKAFNQQIKNNQERFDEDFRFKLTREEVENLRSNFLTSSWGGSRYLPPAFYIYVESWRFLLLKYYFRQTVSYKVRSIFLVFQGVLRGFRFPRLFPGP